tara:strand:+ start:684 stop:836 length:153 start_codon:yes stop_codon:yes gene_type:complete
MDETNKFILVIIILVNAYMAGLGFLNLKTGFSLFFQLQGQKSKSPHKGSK